jgi:hypothetical protein
MFGGPNLDVVYVTSMAKPPLPRFPAMAFNEGASSRSTILQSAACLSPALQAEWKPPKNNRMPPGGDYDWAAPPG